MFLPYQFFLEKTLETQNCNKTFFQPIKIIQKICFILKMYQRQKNVWKENYRTLKRRFKGNFSFPIKIPI